MATYTWSQYAQGSTWVIVNGTYNTDATLYEVLASDATFYVTLPNRSIALTSNVDGQAYYYVPAHNITLTYPNGNTYTTSLGETFYSNPLTKGTTVSLPAITTHNSFSTSTYFRSTNATTAYIDCPVVLPSAQITYTNSGMGYMSLPNITVVTVRVRLNAPPTFDVSSMTFDTAQVYAGLTTASVDVSNLSAKYGGNIDSAVLTIGNQTDTITTDGTLSIALNAGGTFTPTVTVTDSRGQTTTETFDPITVNVYDAPSVSFDADRTTATGVLDDEGAYATLDATFTFTDAIATLQAPTITATDEDGVQTTPTVTWYSSRSADGTLSGSVTWSSLSSGDTVHALLSITGGFNTQKSYQISVTPEDSESTGTPITQTLSTAFYTIDFLAGGHGIAFGQPATQDGFECNMPSTFHDTVEVEDTLTAQDMTAQEIDDFVDSIGGGGDPIADEVIEVGTSGIWTYRKWNSGIAECWGIWSGSLTHYATALGGYAYFTTINYPTSLFVSPPIHTFSAYVGSGFALTGTVTSAYADKVIPYAVSNVSGTAIVYFYITSIGRWK